MTSTVTIVANAIMTKPDKVLKIERVTTNQDGSKSVAFVNTLKNPGQVDCNISLWDGAYLRITEVDKEETEKK